MLRVVLSQVRLVVYVARPLRSVKCALVLASVPSPRAVGSSVLSALANLQLPAPLQLVLWSATAKLHSEKLCSSAVPCVGSLGLAHPVDYLDTCVGFHSQHLPLLCEVPQLLSAPHGLEGGYVEASHALLLLSQQWAC
jgi:hypothetical protein